MAETVTDLTIRIFIDGKVVGDDGALLNVKEAVEFRFADGSGSNQVAKVLQDLSAVTSTTSTDVDLGTKTDFQGVAAAVTKLKVLYVRNKSAAANLVLKQGGSNPLTTLLGGTSPTLTVGPGGIALVINPSAAGWAASANADTIALETTADSQEYTYLAAGGIG